MLNILYEDAKLIVCVKPIGTLSQYDEKDGNNMISLLKERTSENGQSDEIYAVHRLDRNTGGVMIYAKNAKAAAKLSKLITNGGLTKEYFAVVENDVDDGGILHDLLYKSLENNKTYVVDRMRKGVKEAVLEYRKVQELSTPDGVMTLVKVSLHTGRTHQIRVQFSSRGNPLVGDGKYGSLNNKCDVALWSYRLIFEHPYTGKMIDCSYTVPDTYPWSFFNHT